MDEHLLIQRARKGDDDAFGELVRMHQDRIYRTAVRFVGTEDAKDVAQEVFLKAYRELRRFRGKSALSTWLYRMSINISLNYLRGQRREVDRREQYGPGVSAPPPGPERTLQDKELTEAVWEAIEELPDRQRTALILHRFEELSSSQTAEVMGLSVGAVESLLHRAKLTLMQSFLASGLGEAPKSGSGDAKPHNMKNRTGKIDPAESNR